MLIWHKRDREKFFTGFLNCSFVVFNQATHSGWPVGGGDAVHSTVRRNGQV